MNSCDCTFLPQLLGTTDGYSGPNFQPQLSLLLEGQLVRAGLSEFLPSAGDSGRGQLGGEHTRMDLLTRGQSGLKEFTY